MKPETKVECEEAVIAKILQRRDEGRQKYGATMERRDLEFVQWLKHAQEEALDFAIYLEKCQREIKSGTTTSSCFWTEDLNGAWDTSCGQTFCFDDGGPNDNGAKFCCYCGRMLVEQCREDDTNDSSEEAVIIGEVKP